MKMLTTLTLLAALSGQAGTTAVFAQAPAAAPQTPAAGQGAAAPAPGFKAKKLTRADFDALLQRPASVLILDVRRPDELQTIGGFAVYLSVQGAEIEKQLALIPKDRTIVTVSNHANRAGRAADLLASKGFAVAGCIGAQDYEAEGGTLVKIAPPAPRAGQGQ